MWQTRAACIGADTDLFFLEVGKSAAPAQAICRVCEVSADCLRFALDVEGSTSMKRRAGIWGGLTPTQRDQMVDA